MTHAPLFTGINGFGLAAEWMGWEQQFHCEIDSFCQKIIQYYWPNSKPYYDIKKTDFTEWRGKIDIVSGGFPCQGFSYAGLRLGTSDNRYLWPENLRAIREIQPFAYIGENVTGIIDMEDKSGIWAEVFPKMESGQIRRYLSIDSYEKIYTRQAKMLLASICEDLEKEGYQVQSFIIPAASKGAPHRRARIWIIAYSQHYRNSYRTKQIQRKSKEKRMEQQYEIHKSEQSNNVWKINTNSNYSRCENRQCLRFYVQNSNREQSNTTFDKSTLKVNYKNVTHTNCKRRCCWYDRRENAKYVDSRSKAFGFRRNFDGWPTVTPLCFGNDGISEQLDGITFSKLRRESIKAAGNAIVPQIAFEIFKAIESLEQL